jgi:transposase
VAEKSNKDKQDLKDAKKRIKELEKELNRKDKALAEMAALVHSKKNSITSWRTARTIDPSGE